MNSAIDATIKNAYELEGKTPEFIAQDLGYEVTAIKAKLMQISKMFRKECGAEPEEVNRANFDETDEVLFKEVIKDCARFAERPDGSPDYAVRLKAAIYGRDDKKGRHDVVRQIQGGPQFNIMVLNESIQKARLQSQQARKQITESVTVEEVK